MGKTSNHPKVLDHNNITANTAYVETDLTATPPIYGSGGSTGLFFNTLDHVFETDWLAALSVLFLTMYMFIFSFGASILLDALTSSEWLSKVKIA